jgi:hypothetical protein
MGGGTSFTRFLENIGLIQAEKQRLDFEVTDSGLSLKYTRQNSPRRASCFKKSDTKPLTAGRFLSNKNDKYTNIISNS